MQRILIVEDETPMRTALADLLAAEGYRILTATDGENGLQRALAEKPDLILLDVMMPRLDGFALCAELRRLGHAMPVLMLTAKGQVEDRVTGLDAGADDYLVKPFAFAELAARIRTLLRRTGPGEPFKKTIADLVVDLEARRAWRTNQPIELTPREYDLLVFLLRQPGQVVTREMLAKEVWREANRLTPLDNVIDVHVAHLRRKVDEGHDIKLIHTIRGVGFVLREEANG